MSLDSSFPSILAAARLGAEWAWTSIYREYSPAVLRYLRGQGAREPEDLLGEVFLQVVRNVSTFEGDERDFRTWLFLVARNRLIDERRSAGRNPVDSAPDEVLRAVVGTSRTEDDAEARVSHQQVMEVLSRLTPDQRDVIFLRVLAGLPIEEVARVMRKRPGAIKALQSRALATIRREISREAVSFSALVTVTDT